MLKDYSLSVFEREKNAALSHITVFEVLNFHFSPPDGTCSDMLVTDKMTQDFFVFLSFGFYAQILQTK